MTKQRRKPESIADDLQRIDLPPCKYFISTGSTLLDLAIADRYPGGVGSGRTTHITGDNSTAKTVLVQEILGSAQRLGGHAIFADSERTLDFQRAEKLFGLKVGRWAEETVQAEFADMPVDEKHPLAALKKAIGVDEGFTYRTPALVEELWDVEIAGAVELIKEGDLKCPVAIGVDSLSALTSAEEKEDELKDGTYGTSRAKKYSAGFRKYIRDIADTDLTVVGVDQIRDKFGVTFGPKHTTSGGKAIRFYASTRVYLKFVGKILNVHKRAIGVKIEFNIEKNKIGPPFRSGPLHILFEYGVDDITANLEWLKDNGKDFDCKLTVKGPWFSWGEERMGQGITEAVKWAEDGGHEKEIEQEVARIWALVYEPPERKIRAR